MKTFHLLPLMVLLACVTAQAAEVTWDFSSGWAKGFVLKIDSGRKEVSIIDRESGFKSTKELINAEELTTYITGLCNKIPEEGLGIKSTDGVASEVTIRTGDKISRRSVYRVSPSGAIHLNEGYRAAKPMRRPPVSARMWKVTCCWTFLPKFRVGTSKRIWRKNEPVRR